MRLSLLRSTPWILPFSKPALVLFGALIVAVPNCAAAQLGSDTPDAAKRGIRHVLFLTIKSDPYSLFLQQNYDEPYSAALTVKIRISAHSLETNFSGDVPATVSNFDPIKGSREQEVWEDAKCHHERGYPKVTVINIDGSITNGQTKLPISARYRWLGLLLPEDEVMPAKRLVRGTDDVGSFIAIQTETKKSRLFMDLKLYILPCDLQALQTKNEP